MHPAHLEAIVARGKQLARERGLVVFDSFETRRISVPHGRRLFRIEHALLIEEPNPFPR